MQGGRHTCKMGMTPTIARIQQVLILWTWTFALVWLWLWWPRSPGLAMSGMAVALFGFTGVLGIQFLMLLQVRRQDPAPRASGLDLCMAWLAECLYVARVFLWRQPFRWGAVCDQVAGPGDGRRGVVFVHGYGCNRGFWTPWLQRLERQGRKFVAVNLEPPFASIDEQARCLDQAVAKVRLASGRAPVLVCHSMGGLVARAWLRAQKERAGSACEETVVAHVITIGSPHAGTWLAKFGWTVDGRQMRADSPWLQSLAAQWQQYEGQDFTCWWSNADNMVMPPSTASLPGADNRLAHGLAHVQMAFDARVMNESLALIESLD